MTFWRIMWCWLSFGSLTQLIHGNCCDCPNFLTKFQSFFCLQKQVRKLVNISSIWAPGIMYHTIIVNWFPRKKVLSSILLVAWFHTGRAEFYCQTEENECRSLNALEVVRTHFSLLNIGSARLCLFPSYS